MIEKDEDEDEANVRGTIFTLYSALAGTEIGTLQTRSCEIDLEG